jgi:phosphate starvation-inducible PhoH-like protein
MPSVTVKPENSRPCGNQKSSFPRKKRPLIPKTFSQKRYLDLIQEYGLTFGLGPAGSGKTFLAMAMAVVALKNNEVNKIIMTRPAVEAGEALGYLPGDLQEKIFPYLRPLYDALYEMMEIEEIQRMMDRGIIEIAPLAYMRGRTLSNAFVILDEGQNTTTEQMFMFLTRLGLHTQMCRDRGYHPDRSTPK